MNLIPEAGGFGSDGYTTEEAKLQNETVKILDDPSIRVTATAVRVPVTGGHSEAVNIEFEKPFKTEEARELLSSFPGVKVIDEPLAHRYPMPVDARDKNEVFVGRVRRDPTIPNGLNLWIVADNLRKGAATNAVQILSLLVRKGLIKNEGL
jgi:aspartate-semialdehyde dehydrogenase